MNLLRPYSIHTPPSTATCVVMDYISWTGTDETGKPLVYRVSYMGNSQYVLRRAYADSVQDWQKVCTFMVESFDWDLVYLEALEKLGEGNSADAHRVRTARDLENLERVHLAQVAEVNRRIARDNWIATGLGCLALAMFAVVMYIYG